MSSDAAATGTQAPCHAATSTDDSLPAAKASCVLRLRGLPFLATSNDVREFFSAFELAEVYICRRDGRSTGEAYVVLWSPHDAKNALQDLNKKYMGSRYIEIFEAAEADLAAVKRVLEDARLQGFVVRLRGLPYSATAEDVTAFLAGVQLADVEDAIVFAHSVDGRPSGEAYVELADEQALSLAMTRHKELMGSRYIEIFSSSKVDKLMALQNTKYHTGPPPRSRWAMTQPGLAGMPGGAMMLQGTVTGAAATYMPMAGMADQLAGALNATHISAASSPSAQGGSGSAAGTACLPYPGTMSSAVPISPLSGVASVGVALPAYQAVASPAAASGQQYLAPAPVAEAVAAASRSIRASPNAAMSLRVSGAPSAAAVTPVASPAAASPYQQMPHGAVVIGPNGQHGMQYYMPPQGGMVWAPGQPQLLHMMPAGSAAAAAGWQPDTAQVLVPAPAGMLPQGMPTLRPAPAGWHEGQQCIPQAGVQPMMVPAADMQQYASYQWQHQGVPLPAGTKSLPQTNTAGPYMYNPGL